MLALGYPTSDTARMWGAHIFKRFYRSRFSKDTQGIGLGLPLAKAIIEAHGGLIEVESELGIGTSFIMNFPIPTKL